MSALEPLKKAVDSANSWIARNVLYVAIVVFIVVVVCVSASTYYSHKLTEAAVKNPPLPKSEAKAVRKASAAAEQTAKVAIQVAAERTVEANTSKQLAKKAKTQADSIRRRYEKTPVIAPGTAADLERRLSNYQSPF